MSAWKPASPGVSTRLILRLLPVEVAERGRERHLPLLLVLVPVRDRRARLDRAEPVDRAGLEEQRLDERRLARAAMADDGDVADLPGLVDAGMVGVFLGAMTVNLELQASRPRPWRGPSTPPRRAFRRRIAFVWSCETRDSVTPSTSPISRRVSSS